MNVLFFLKPKIDVVYVDDQATLRQAMEKMEFHRYSSVPIIDRRGKYVGTLSEGDILWHIKAKKEFTLEDAERILVRDVKRNRDNAPVKVDAKLENLLDAVEHQNFAPVIDDREIMIGIVTRQDIIRYLVKETHEKERA